MTKITAKAITLKNSFINAEYLDLMQHYCFDSSYTGIFKCNFDTTQILKVTTLHIRQSVGQNDMKHLA